MTAPSAPRSLISRLRYALAPALLLVAVGVLMAAQLRDASSTSASSASWPVPPAPVSLMIGATTTPLARNSYERWGRDGLDSIERFERSIGGRVGVVMWFSDWANVARPDVEQLQRVQERGSIPEITWEPWDSAKALYTAQPNYRLSEIIKGRFDSLIRRWARDLAAYGGLVRLRFAHEMNGNWYPWSETANGNRPGEFARAWRHVWRIFASEGADNVQWVWSPVALRIKPAEYPGDRYVDRLGLSGFVGGVQLRFARYRPFSEVFGDSLRAFDGLAPGKPVEISELGVAEQGGAKDEFIREMFRTLEATRQIDTVVWFNLIKKSDWRVQSSRRAAGAFAAGYRLANARRLSGGLRDKVIALRPFVAPLARACLGESLGDLGPSAEVRGVLACLCPARDRLSRQDDDRRFLDAACRRAHLGEPLFRSAPSAIPGRP